MEQIYNCNKIHSSSYSLLNDNILDQSKFKAFADGNVNMYQRLKFALRKVENIVGKRGNADY